MSSDESPEDENSEAEVVDPWADLPGDVGDDREKFVRVTIQSGEEIEHSDVYFRYTDQEFIISPTMDFEDDEITRYSKAETRRVEILQHHPKCFITTAVTQDEQSLHLLRGFRDDVLIPTRGGRILVSLYEHVSPSVARTLTRFPESRLTAVIRWFVHQSANLEQRRRNHAKLPRIYIPLIVGMYSVGLLTAICGTGMLQLRFLIRDRKSAEHFVAD